MSQLHARIAAALGWPVSETLRMSLPTLRELVRGVDRDLAAAISAHLATDGHVVQAPAKRTQAQPFVVGDRVRCSGRFLRSTGQHTGADAHRVWTVLGVEGAFVVVDEERDTPPDADDTRPLARFRRFHAGNLLLATAPDLT